MNVRLYFVIVLFEYYILGHLAGSCCSIISTCERSIAKNYHILHEYNSTINLRKIDITEGYLTVETERANKKSRDKLPHFWPDKC